MQKNQNNDLEQIYVDTPNHWKWDNEMLWARKLGENLYEIMSIPYAAYGLNKGDVVETKPCNDTKMARVESVANVSGHRTVRVIFVNRLMPLEERANLMDGLQSEFGCEFERVNDNYYTIDIAGPVAHEKLCQNLSRLQTGGIIAYETCEPRETGSFGDLPSDHGRVDGVIG